MKHNYLYINYTYLSSKRDKQRLYTETYWLKLSDLCIYKSIVLCSLQFLTSALVIYSVLSFLAACAYDILTLEAAR